MAEPDIVVKDEPQGSEPRPASAVLQDGEDEVVAEIDVVLSNLDTKTGVWVNQYPLRPPWRPYDLDQLQQVRYKRTYNILEMDYELTMDEAADKDVAETAETENATVVDAAGNEVKKKLEKHTLRSSTVPLRTNYAVGVYHGTKLYLTPVTGIFQMRPAFDDLEDMEAKKKREMEEMAQTRVDGISVHSKKRPDNDKAAARDRSYKSMKQQEDEDPWRVLEFVDRDRPESLGIFEMLSSTEGESKAQFDVSRQEYLTMINPVQYQLEADQKNRLDKEKEEQIKNDPRKRKDFHESDLIPRISSIGGSDVLEPEIRVKAIMWNCGIATFSTLRRLISPPSDKVLLKLLEASCVFVSGRWTLKSDLVCKAPRLALARQALLVRWAQDDNTLINRRTFSNLWRVDPDDLKKVLSPIADLIPPVYEIDADGVKREVQGPGWRLKLVSDRQPSEGVYEKLEKRYSEFWQDISLQLDKQIDNLQFGNLDDVGLGAAKTFEGSVFETKTAVDPNISGELQTIIRDLLINHGVIKISFLRHHIGTKLNAGELKYVTANVPDTVLRQELSVLAEPLHDVWVRRCGSSWNLKDDKHRKAVYDLFAAAKDRRIKRNAVENSVRERTGSPIPRLTYNALMKELAVSVGGSWVLRSGDGTQRSDKEAATTIDD